MIIHLADAHHLYACPHCKKVLKGSNAYKKHMKDAHIRRACLYCVTRTFTTEEAYQSHKDAVHFRYKQHCLEENCGQRFPTLERYVVHALKEHKRYVCLECLQKELSDEKQTINIAATSKKEKYLEHMRREHRKIVCLRCNMQTFESWEDYKRHCGDCEVKTIKRMCTRCMHPNTFRCKAEQRLHGLQHAFLSFFLQETICANKCCVPFRKAVADVYAGDEYSKEEKENSAIKAVRELVDHIQKKHGRCLFCENPVTDQSRETLKTNSIKLTYKQIAEDARVFIRLKEDTLPKGEIHAILCEMCESPLQPNQKSRLFSASIARLPFGEGLNTLDYPFHHLAYDERKAEKNTMMSIIKEVPANEEEEEKEKEDKKKEKAKTETKKEK